MNYYNQIFATKIENKTEKNENKIEKNGKKCIKIEIKWKKKHCSKRLILKSSTSKLQLVTKHLCRNMLSI